MFTLERDWTYLDVPDRKLGSMVSKWVITLNNPFTNYLLASWDIQVMEPLLFFFWGAFKQFLFRLGQGDMPFVKILRVG